MAAEQRSRFQCLVAKEAIPSCRTFAGGKKPSGAGIPNMTILQGMLEIKDTKTKRSLPAGIRPPGMRYRVVAFGKRLVERQARVDRLHSEQA